MAALPEIFEIDADWEIRFRVTELIEESRRAIEELRKSSPTGPSVAELRRRFEHLV